MVWDSCSLAAAHRTDQIWVYSKPLFQSLTPAVLETSPTEAQTTE